MSAITKHSAPIHPGTGTGQDVHGGGGPAKIRIERSGGERPCSHPNCATIHWGKEDAVWDSSGDHIVADNTWRVMDADTSEDLWREGAGVQGLDTKREAIEWAEQNYPGVPIDSTPTPKSPKTPELEVDFWGLTNIKQAKEMGMLASKWVALSDEEQRRLWEAKNIAKHAAPIHPGTGTGQDVHGGDAGAEGNSSDELTANLSDDVMARTEPRFNVPSWFQGREAPPGHYWVSNDRIGGVKDKLEKASRRAAKHGLEPFTHEIVDRHEQLVSEGGQQWVHSWSLVKVDGPVPQFEGWQFAARIEHLPTEEGDAYFNVIHSRPNLEVIPPDEYRDSGPNCDVCKRNVYRKDTFLVHNTETGEWKQVGRDDLKLFTGGRNPAADMAYMRIWDDMEAGADDDFFGSEKWQNKYLGSVEGYLTAVAAEVRDYGYVSRSSLMDDYGHRLDDGRKTTAEKVMDPDYHKNENEPSPVVNAGDEKLALAAKEHYAGYETPAEVTEYKEFEQKWRSEDPDQRMWGSPDLQPPSPEEFTPGSHYWRNGGGSEGYQAKFDEWKRDIQGTAFDPTGDAEIKMEDVDGVRVEVLDYSVGAANKRERDLHKALSNDDFMRNMQAAASAPFATAGTAGILAYAIPGYQKHQVNLQLAELKASQPVSQWIGEPKKRQEFPRMTIEMVRSGEGTYGDWTLTKLRTPEGNSITTWYGGEGLWVPDKHAEPRYEGEVPTRMWAAGDTISAKATVKEHTVDAYADDERTTVIQRLANVTLHEEDE